MKRPVQALLTDLDNTLWDWVDIWHSSFGALREVVIRAGFEADAFDTEARRIHQRHGTTEYALLLEELPFLATLPSRDRALIVRQAVHASQEARRASLKLYPGVLESLEKIRDMGCLVVAYTESMAFYTAQRIRKLGLDGVLDYLYSSPDHDFPRDTPPESIRRYPFEHYMLKQTEHRHTPPGVQKPSAEVLLSILDDLGIATEHVVYVGDSLMKDVAMAQEAGVADVWAKYGIAQHRQEYELLRRVTHWNDIDVAREQRITNSKIVVANHILETGFAQILDLFRFEKHSNR